MNPSTPATSALRISGSDLITILSIVMSTAGLAIALAALVFTGPSADALPRAISSFIIGGAVVGLFLGLRSRFDSLIAGAQDSAAIVLLAVTASVAASATDDPATATIVLMSISCAITGIAMWLVGRLGLGNVIRSLPTTVVAGFVAGTGWLLLIGGLSVMVNGNINLLNLPTLFHGTRWHYWVPGLSLAIVILLCSSSRRLPPFMSSLLIFIAVAVFFAIGLGQSTMDTLADNQWLIGPFPASGSIQLITPAELSAFPWAEFLSNAQIILPVILVCCIGVLLNLSGLEFIFNQRADLNAELKSAGIANVVIAPFGGMIGYHLMGSSTLAKQLGASNKLIPVGVSVVSILLAVFGSQVIGYLPRFVAGGVLAAAGLSLLSGWLRDQLPSFFRLDRLLSVVIVAVIALVGILEGIAVGIAIASVIFIIQYSRINPVRYLSSGVEMQSRMDRPAAVVQALSHVGQSTAILELQGYLFFGSITQIAKQIEARVDVENAPANVVIDCRLVTGIDVSGFAVLKQIADDLAQRDVAFMLSGLSPDMTQRLERAQPGLLKSDLIIDTLDHALEKAENNLLARIDLDQSQHETTTPDPSQKTLSDPLLALFEIVTLGAGETLIGQNQPVNNLYIVKDGIGIVYHVKGDTTRERIRRFEQGTLLGEIGFLLHRNSTAEVVADTSMTLYSMTREQFRAIRDTNAALAFELDDFLLSRTAVRVSSISSHFTKTLR